MGEIVELMRDGAIIIPYYEELVDSFPKVSGVSFADAWIRREIAKFSNALEQGLPTGKTTIPRVIS